MLILVEPGTPLGSANIQEARSQILSREQRRAGKINKRMEQQVEGEGGEGGVGKVEEMTDAWNNR